MTAPQVWKAAESIHATVCYDNLEYCFEGNGGCIKAATNLYRDGLLKEDQS